MEKRKADLIKRAQTDEKIRKSFLHSANVQKAIEEVSRAAQEVKNRGGWQSGRRDPILDWSHWSLTKLLAWWKKRVQARNKELKKQRANKGKRTGGMGGSSGQRKIEELWGRMRGMHVKGVEGGKKCRGVGDGADDPG